MPEDTPHPEIVTLAESSDATSAELIASMLREEGVDARSVGGHIEALPGAPSYSNVQILVPESDYERAAAMLRAIEETAESAPFRICPRCQHSLNGGEDFATCPECGIDLSDLAKRIRHRWLISPPPGEGRRPGALLAWLILLGLIIFPVLYAGAMLATHPDPIVRFVGIVMVALVVFGFGLALFFNLRRRGPGKSGGDDAPNSGTQPSA